MLKAYDLGPRRGEFEALLGRHKDQEAALKQFQQLLSRIENRFGLLSSDLAALGEDVRALTRQQQNCLPRAVPKAVDYRARFKSARSLPAA